MIHVIKRIRNNSKMHIVRGGVSFVLAFIAACLLIYVPLALPFDAAGDHTARGLLGFAAAFALLSRMLKS